MRSQFPALRSSFNSILKMAVIKPWNRCVIELKHHVGNYVAALCSWMFENRVTVAVGTVLNSESDKFFLLEIVAEDPADDILDLDAVGTYVLDCRRTDLSRDA